jgi:hypothetical protein
MRSRPRQLARISINTGGQSSFWQAFSELQNSTCAHYSCLVCAQVWRRVVIAAAAASKFRFWLGLSLGYGLDYLINSCLVHYPWGKVRYPLFGYLA